ncbi:FHA domain-containing protein [Crocosphaera watsonii]|uniref:FHA domain containing protein n=5 Tax=Crocosphaera TaxID=263510 RepID=T2JEZ1_CROWT|nr:FHA domain-containing protein [Crocosphaera watsonii]CCQ63609.1 FHA domain containing protein [Crocosphaera watsonii WH 0401]
MITCPNCDHENPDGAVQCEACFTPLPRLVKCGSCGLPLLSSATFCGECGAPNTFYGSMTSVAETSPPPPPMSNLPEESSTPPPPPPMSNLPEEGSTPPPPPPTSNLPEEGSTPPPPPPMSNLPEESSTPPPPPPKPAVSPATQLQTQTASLLHVQTDTTLEMPQGLEIIHIGKPNEQIPPDLDVSGLPDADVVSRIHADIRNEAGIFYIEDVGSSNGTYINYNALSPGNRHRLRPGDRISLGKGDLVTFIFQLS